MIINLLSYEIKKNILSRLFIHICKFIFFHILTYLSVKRENKGMKYPTR
jgi:hypothetical protein